jgi:hypothetical protein
LLIKSFNSHLRFFDILGRNCIPALHKEFDTPILVEVRCLRAPHLRYEFGSNAGVELPECSTIYELKSSSSARWNKEQFDVIGVSRIQDSLGQVTRINIEDKDARACVRHSKVQPIDVGHNEVVS